MHKINIFSSSTTWEAQGTVQRNLKEFFSQTVTNLETVQFGIN